MNFNNFGTFVGYLKHEVKPEEQYFISVDFKPGYTTGDGSIHGCARTYTVTDNLSQIIATHQVKNIVFDDWREMESEVGNSDVGFIYRELRPYFKEKELELITNGGKFWLERVNSD